VGQKAGPERPGGRRPGRAVAPGKDVVNGVSLVDASLASTASSSPAGFLLGSEP
jgi:hypothetical protein